MTVSVVFAESVVDALKPITPEIPASAFASNLTSMTSVTGTQDTQKVIHLVLVVMFFVQFFVIAAPDETSMNGVNEGLKLTVVWNFFKTYLYFHQLTFFHSCSYRSDVPNVKLTVNPGSTVKVWYENSLENVWET